MEKEAMLAELRVSYEKLDAAITGGDAREIRHTSGNFLAIAEILVRRLEGVD